MRSLPVAVTTAAVLVSGAVAAAPAAATAVPSASTAAVVKAPKKKPAPPRVIAHDTKRVKNNRYVQVVVTRDSRGRRVAKAYANQNKSTMGLRYLSVGYVCANGTQRTVKGSAGKGATVAIPNCGRVRVEAFASWNPRGVERLSIARPNATVGVNVR